MIARKQMKLHSTNVKIKNEGGKRTFIVTGKLCPNCLVHEVKQGLKFADFQP